MLITKQVLPSGIYKLNNFLAKMCHNNMLKWNMEGKMYFV